MRILKFRAWTGTEMVADAITAAWREEEHFDDILLPPYWQPTVVHCNMRELMQYTGLKDRNGVEIYEGDILATENHENLDTTDEWDEEIIGSVLLDTVEGLSMIHPNGGPAWLDHDTDDSIFSLRFVAVIGNIYEHPHLMEGE